MKKQKQTKRPVTRRSVLKGAAAASLVVAAPPYIKNALATGGELNIYMWSDYLPQNVRDQFKEETGITINFNGIGDNDELINKMKATRGRGVDIVTPTSDRALQWQPLEFLQPYDLSRVPVERINEATLAVGTGDWNYEGKGAHWLPNLWGTEAIAWRTDKWQPQNGVPSLGDIWAEDVAGKMMGRSYSMVTGAGRYMETIGELEPGDMKRAYSDEATMRPIWQKVTDWCVARKDHVGKFWKDADSQKSGFLQDGMVIGQVWDGPSIALKREGHPVTYQAPSEGAFAWVDGLSLMRAARNIEEVYAFIEFMFRPEIGGELANKTGYNSPVLGSDAYLTPESKQTFEEAYPGDAANNLWPWPPTPQWYSGIRQEYANVFEAA